MVRDSARKGVLVLSDDERLAKVIEVILKRDYREVVGLPLRSLQRREGEVKLEDFDLVVVATGSLASESVVASAMDLLAQWVGRVPMLIVSEGKLDSDPGHQIFHLDFPFDVDELAGTVDEILRGARTVSENQ